MHTDPIFNALIFSLILANALLQGLQVEMPRESYPTMHRGLDVFDDITIVIFILEIVLKWIDSFKDYWQDGWNIFDFTVTILVRSSPFTPWQ